MASNSKLSWYAHRLKAMSVSELVKRVGDQWKHQSDRSFADRVEKIHLGSTVIDLPSLPERDACPDKLRDRLATDVKKLLQGEWRLFGWREVDTGAPPCWHRDASCGVVIEPDNLSFKLDHRSLPDGADPRAIWEINRWSEMTRVAMHAWINQDPDSARTAQIWLEDWCDRNPAGHGINWTSTMEVGLRLINFCWFDALITALRDPTLLQHQKRLAQRVVPAHALWVSRYRSYGTSANNHLIGELTGLLHAVKRWPALEAHIGTSQEIWHDLSACILDQFADDGGNKEQALHYHLFAWEMSWHASQLMQLKSSPVIQRLRRAAEFFVRMVHPLESWDYGDSDDAQVLPIVLDRGDSPSEWQSWLANHGHGDAISYWMGHSPMEETVTRALEQPGWWLAEQSGMAVCELNDWMLRFDASPLGLAPLAAHGHCDALHLSLWDGPHALVIDPGTADYYGMSGRRPQLMSWSLHNGPSPAYCFKTPHHQSTFLWEHHHSKPVSEWISPRKIKATLSHEDRLFSREVEITNAGVIMVTDQCEAGTELVVQWIFAPECSLDESDAPNIIIKRDDKQWRLALDSSTIKSAHVGEIMVSRHYGMLEPAVTLKIVAKEILLCTWSRV